MRLSLFCAFLSSITCYFTADFNEFLTKRYGEKTQQLLERKDFDRGGSFGGRASRGEKIKKQPVIIVHGVTNIVDRFSFMREFLYAKGYSGRELYGTTYGEGPREFIVFVKLECSFIKQIRLFIEAVYQYTGSKVDILAYSMGSPITRKAIMGGDCQGTQIGPPLTYMVDTFVGIAGANFGSFLCFIPLAICNVNNGLNCRSHMLSDINSKPWRYEADYTFAIYSNKDEKVGPICCGKNCSSIPHSSSEFLYTGLGHDEVMLRSVILQYELITAHNGTVSWYDSLDTYKSEQKKKEEKQLFDTKSIETKNITTV